MDIFMKKFKIGIAGFGRAAYFMHCPELDKMQEQFEIVGACDIDKNRLDEFQKRYPGTFVRTDFKEFVKEEMDIVSIVVPSVFHVEYAKIALEAGKKVYLEKPIALNDSEADELEKLDKLYPNRIFVRHNRRFEAAFNHITEIIDSGRLGEIFEVKLCRHRFQMRNDWQTIPECGGGQLNNWGPHLIDHALIFLGSPVRKIYANCQRINCEGDAEDHVKFILEGENGRVVDVEISDGALLAGDVYFIIGTKGTLRCSDEKIIELKTLPQNFKLPVKKPHAESLPRNCGYGDIKNISFETETIEVAPANQAAMDKAYSFLYAALCGSSAYPISMDHALDVVRTTGKIRRECKIILR